jgi:hypothetical protein
MMNSRDLLSIPHSSFLIHHLLFLCILCGELKTKEHCDSFTSKPATWRGRERDVELKGYN